jgi:Flp pilus assembly protein TadB
MIGLLAGFTLFASGALLLVWNQFGTSEAALASRLTASRSQAAAGGASVPLPPGLAPPLSRWLARTNEQLRLTGAGKTVRRFLLDKLAAAAALPLILALPYLAATGHPPSGLLELMLVGAGFFLPDLALRQAAKHRRERILLDLPEGLSMIALGLGAGQSLRQALELAARDSPGPLGTDIAAALSRARREQALDERQALVQVAQESGEPAFARFAELLASKESPYLDFLRTHAAQARAEQNRLLEQAADRAYLAMQAPLAPLLTTLVLVVSYGFLHLLDQSI